MNHYQKVWVKAYKDGEIVIECNSLREASTIKQALYRNVRKFRNSDFLPISEEEKDIFRAINNCEIVKRDNIIKVKKQNTKRGRKPKEPVLIALGLLSKQETEIKQEENIDDLLKKYSFYTNK